MEAQRLGLPSRGSDLNPIPVLISKALTELPPAVVDRPPLHLPGQGLFEGTHGVGYPASSRTWSTTPSVFGMKHGARIGHLYPRPPTGIQ